MNLSSFGSNLDPTLTLIFGAAVFVLGLVLGIIIKRVVRRRKLPALPVPTECLGDRIAEEMRKMGPPVESLPDVDDRTAELETPEMAAEEIVSLLSRAAERAASHGIAFHLLIPPPPAEWFLANSDHIAAAVTKAIDEGKLDLLRAVISAQAKSKTRSKRGTFEKRAE